MIQITFNTSKTSDTVNCHMVQIGSDNTVYITGITNPTDYHWDEDITNDKEIDDAIIVKNHKFLRIK